jgi:chromatin modification-related protein YNG2
LTSLHSIESLIYPSELQQEIAKESTKYIRHSLRNSPASSVHSTPGTSSAASPSPPTPNINGNANPKAHLLPKIASSYSEIDRLSVEKIALAQRIVTLIARTRARLEIDLQKVGILQGDVIDPNSALYGSNMVGREISSSFLSRDASLAASSGGLGGYGTRGNNPAAQISQSLRNALGSGGVDPDMPPQKSRYRYGQYYT